MSYELPKLKVKVIHHPSKHKVKKTYALNRREPQPLPDILYHTTTNLSGIKKEGIKSRSELNQDFGHGLGGGPSDIISFTTDISVAKAIKKSILKYHHFLNYNTLLSQFDKEASRLHIKEELDKYMNGSWGDQWRKVIEEGKIRRSAGVFNAVDGAELLARGDIPLYEGIYNPNTGKTKYLYYLSDATDKEILDYQSAYFKAFSAFAEEAGGDFNPLYFLENTEAIRDLDPEEVAILQYKPRKYALGFQESSLSEWRAFPEDIQLVSIL